MITLYFMEIDEQADSSVIQALLPLISREKQQQIEMIRFEADRKLHIYSEGLVRICACEMLNRKNRDLTFAHNKFGKPYLPEYTSFHFNISHTRNAVAAAFSDVPVGVDIEKINKADPYAARKVFTPGEFEYVFSGMHDEEQSAGLAEDIRFSKIWTRKESYIKWTGTGWSADMSDIDVLRDPPASRITTHQMNPYVLSVCSAAENKLSGIITMTEQSLLSKMNDIII